MELRQPLEFINKDNPANEVIDLGFGKIDFDKAGADLTISTSDTKKKRGSIRKPSSSTCITDTDDIVENNNALPLRYKECYRETDNMLRQSLGQIDMASGMLEKDLGEIRNSRTLKNKYGYIKDLLPSQAQLINTKVSVIKEMNNIIGKINDMEYKRTKDFKSVDETSTDKMIMDLYSGIISNPQSFQGATVPTMSTNILVDNNVGFIGVDDTVQGQQPIGGSGNNEAAFNNYMQNLSPEQNMMLMETNKNVKPVVCYDPVTGSMYFDVYDMSSMQPVPNVPRKSPVFLEGIKIDQQQGVARNPNLRETYPLIIVSENDNIGNPNNRLI